MVSMISKALRCPKSSTSTSGFEYSAVETSPEAGEMANAIRTLR